MEGVHLVLIPLTIIPCCLYDYFDEETKKKVMCKLFLEAEQYFELKPGFQSPLNNGKTKEKILQINNLRQRHSTFD